MHIQVTSVSYLNKRFMLQGCPNDEVVLHTNVTLYIHIGTLRTNNIYISCWTIGNGDENFTNV